MLTKLHDIYSLTLDKFINCYCDRELSLLIISGEPSLKELELAWNDILEEYNSSLVDTTGIEANYIQRLITWLQLKCNAIDLIISRLSIQFDVNIWNELNEYTEQDLRTIDLTNPEAIRQGLEYALSTKRIYEADIDQHKTEMQELFAPRKGQTEIINKKSFSKIILALSEHNGYQVDRSKTTVNDFIEMVLILRRKIEKLESKN